MANPVWSNAPDIINQWFVIFGLLKWSASSRWSSFLYCLMRNWDEMTIGKTHPILVFSRKIEIFQSFRPCSKFLNEVELFLAGVQQCCWQVYGNEMIIQICHQNILSPTSSNINPTQVDNDSYFRNSCQFEGSNIDLHKKCEPKPVCNWWKEKIWKKSRIVCPRIARKGKLSSSPHPQ